MDPTGSFALTKIRAPRPRPGLLPRARIEAPLAEALAQQRLTVLSAPAGYGKTALLTRGLAALAPDTAVAWISADADDDLARFAACLFAALDPFDLPWRSSPDALAAALGNGAAARPAVATDLINALAASECSRGLIVLEDAHRIADPAVFEFLDLLLARLPEHWGIVVASRVDPPLALARWRARGELAEFRQEQLRFSDAEVAALLETLPQPRDAAALRGLLERTEGWAAGLRMVLGGAREATAAPAGSGRRHLFDYLATEVLDDMPEALRAFLLRSAVLPELSPERCAAVAREPQAAALLAQIEQRGLFVTVLDDQEPVLRLHDLFRDFLEDRLKRDHPYEVPGLLERAAALEPDPVRRIGYLLQAGAWESAEEELVARGADLIAAGAIAPVQRLIEQFPAEWREDAPRLDHLRGLCAWGHWDIVAMCAALERAAAGFARRGEHDAAQRSRVLEVIALTAGGALPQAVERLAQVQRGPMDRVTETTAAQAASWHALGRARMDEVAAPLARMVELLEQGGEAMLWFQCVPPTSLLGLPGTRQPLQRYVDGARRRAPAEPPTPLRVLADILQAGLHLWAGRSDAALALLQSAADDCRWLNRPPNLIGHLHTYTALTHAVRGEREAALAAADGRIAGLVADERTSGRRAVWINNFLYFKARIAAALDDGATLRELAAQIAAHPNPAEPALLVGERAGLPARLAALEGRWADAAAGFADALRDEAAIDLYGQASETRLRLAHALLQLGRTAQAAAALLPVFAKVAGSGELGGVLLAGPTALAALARADWGDRLTPVQRESLHDWARRVPAAAGAAPPPAAAPVAATADPATDAPLSGREAEVLARLAAGDSNKLIARAFDLSPHTVKRHVANILDKLGVQSRGQAAAWYRNQVLR